MSSRQVGMLFWRIGGALLITAVLPGFAAAQHSAGMSEAKHELGVDIGLTYNHEGSLGGVSCSTDCGTVSIGTPLDVRFGFVSSGPVSFEPRFTFNYISHAGGHLLSFVPDLNLLYRLSGTARSGPYLTGGVGYEIASASSSGGSSSTATQLSLNGGIGVRAPYESAAWRFEGFFRYNFENSGKSIPSSYDIGARIGLSLFH